jgi:hypothetical protein
MRYQRHLSGPARKVWQRVVERAPEDEISAYVVATAPRYVSAYEDVHDGRRVMVFAEPADPAVSANGLLARERLVNPATGSIVGVRAVGTADIAHNDRALVAHGLRRAPAARRTLARVRGAGRPRRRAGASSRTASADPGDSDPASPAASADRSSALAAALSAVRLRLGATDARNHSGVAR